MSTLLDQASLVLIPSGYKEDIVYSQKPTDGSGDLTFTRASDGTRVNSAGYVENVPWNLLEYSEDFSNTSIWNVLNGASISSNTAVAPNGTTTADTLTFSANPSSNVYCLTTQTAGTFTVSVYAKTASGTKKFRLRADAPNGMTSSDFIATTEWQRFDFSVTGTPVTFYIINDAAGTAGSIYIWGAQLNQGTLKPYFPTTDRQNVPRLDYSNGCPSLLLEPQRTNYAIYSQDLTQSATAFGGGTVGANTTTSPDGTQNADSFTVNTATSGHGGYYETASATNGQQFTASVFLKAGTGRYFLFRAMTNSYDTRFGATIDLQAGTILSTNTAGSPTGTASKIENFGNGWYRVSLTITAVGNQMSYVWAASNTGTPTLDAYLDYSYTGNGTDSYYVWGMTLENSSYPTSYIPTTSAAVTRVADTASKTGISSLIGQTEGTLFVDFNLQTPSGNDYVIGQIYNSSSPADSIYFYVTGANFIEAYVDNSGNQVRIIPPSASAQGRYKLAIAYKANEFKYYVNGTLIGTDTSGTVPTCNSINLINYANGGGYIEKSAVNQYLIFKTSLTNDQLAALTTL